MAEAVTKIEKIPEKLTLRQKMLAVMRDLEDIEERGENRAQGYTYVMAADVILAARRAFIKHGIVFNANEVEIKDLEDFTTRSGAIMHACRVTMGFSFLDADSDDQLYVVSTGEGQDSGDKSIYKAKTGALKYALQNNLLLAAGDDAEDDKGEEELVERRSTKPLSLVRDRKCPNCGALNSMVRNKSSGMWQCWRSKGGCEGMFTDEQVEGDPQGSVEPSDVATPPAEEESPRMTEKVVATEEMIDPLRELIKLSSDPKATEAAILSRCGVKSLGDLTPKQVEWQVSTLQRKVQERDKGKRPRK